jgi:MFS family permease
VPPDGDDRGASLIGGVAMLGLTIRPPLLVAGILIVIVGGSSGLVTPIVSASLQEMTPKELMARVFGVFNTGTMVSAMIGMTLFGWAADRFNPAASVLAIGGIILGTAAITVLMIPAYLRLTKMTAVAT